MLEEAPGEWRFEDGWPIGRIREQALYPQPNHTLSAAVPPSATHSSRYTPTTGIEAGGPVMWFGDVAPDQKPTDAFSLVYDSDPLEQDQEILGLPRALLQVSADAPLVHWFARLCDVAPDGTVTLVASAGFNGAHRESAENPKAIEPGRRFPLEIEMHFTSWVFPKGHRMRFAVHNAHWPMIWPTPYTTLTSLYLGGAEGTRLMLPVVPHEERPRPTFLASEKDPEMPGFRRIEEETASGYGEIAKIERDTARRATKVTAVNNGATQLPWGTQRSEETIVHETQDDHPEATTVKGQYRTTVTLKDRTLVWESAVEVRSDLENFYYTNIRRLLKDGSVLREKTWKDTIPRDHQ